VQQEYQAFSEEAVRLGVFGAPTFIVRGHTNAGGDRTACFFVDRFLDRLRG
jgi:2-hydroxychromene-2-carboxylate isomerase